MSRLTRATWLLIAALPLAGCGSLLTSDLPAETTYWLDPPPPRTIVAARPVASSIGVHVTAAPGLDTNRILIRGPGATLNHYAGAVWPDHIPEVLDTLIRTALEDSQRFRRVVSGREAARSDWQLNLDVRAFYAVAISDSEPPSVDVKVRGYLRCPGGEVPLVIAHQAQASQNRRAAIVAGFQEALDAALLTLLDELVSC